MRELGLCAICNFVGMVEDVEAGDFGDPAEAVQNTDDGIVQMIAMGSYLERCTKWRPVLCKKHYEMMIKADAEIVGQFEAMAVRMKEKS